MGNPKPTPNPQSPVSLGNQPASHTNPSLPPTWICREDSDPERQGIQLGLLHYGNFIYVDPNKNITIETGYRLSQYRSRPNPFHTVTLSNLKKKKLGTGSFSGIYTAVRFAGRHGVKIQSMGGKKIKIMIFKTQIAAFERGRCERLRYLYFL